MPRPPILPLLDWEAILAGGQPFDVWLAAAEDPGQRQAVEAGLDVVRLETHEVTLLGGLSRKVHVAAIAEAWCGDVVRQVPVLRRLELASEGRLEVRFLTREQHPEVLARFLTNGGEAIPKFVFLGHDFTECGHWGPMPRAGRLALSRGKACGDLKAARRLVAAMYEADPERRETVRELLALATIAAAEKP